MLHLQKSKLFSQLIVFLHLGKFSRPKKSDLDSKMKLCFSPNLHFTFCTFFPMLKLVIAKKGKILICHILEVWEESSGKLLLLCRILHLLEQQFHLVK